MLNVKYLRVPTQKRWLALQKSHLKKPYHGAEPRCLHENGEYHLAEPYRLRLPVFELVKILEERQHGRDIEGAKEVQ